MTGTIFKLLFPQVKTYFLLTVMIEMQDFSVLMENQNICRMSQDKWNSPENVPKILNSRLCDSQYLLVLSNSCLICTSDPKQTSATETKTTEKVLTCTEIPPSEKWVLRITFCHQTDPGSLWLAFVGLLMSLHHFHLPCIDFWVIYLQLTFPISEMSNKERLSLWKCF